MVGYKFVYNSAAIIMRRNRLALRRIILTGRFSKGVLNIRLSDLNDTGIQVSFLLRLRYASAAG